MKSQVLGLCVLLFAIAIVRSVDCNSEGDALNIFKNALSDPNNVLQSWDPALVNPCTWFHVTCNGQNSVTRVDLGHAGLSGHLVPQLGQLENLQYLELYGNNISGSIPSELGNLKKLISLDLYRNQLTGSIPPTLGNVQSLRFLRIHHNRLTGEIPSAVFQLVSWGNLLELDLSHNYLAGASRNKSKTVTTRIKQDARA